MAQRATPHRLDPLLRRRGVAVVGASVRKDSMGEFSLASLVKGGFAGAGMSGVVDCDERVAINIAVSTGNQLSVNLDE